MGDQRKMVQLRVAASSQIDKVGSAAVRFYQEGNNVELLAMGARVLASSTVM